jgi:predicted N-acetyltransferase YhbS
MNTNPFSYRLEQSNDNPAIETLHREVFGPGRFARAAYRLREGVPHDPRLSFVAHAADRLIASVRMTPIAIGTRPALLLGPLVVIPSVKGQGAGKNLVRIAVEAAGEAGHNVVMLVGDEEYYGPLGFSRLAPYAITFFAPVDPERVLVIGLADGALEGLFGQAGRVVGTTF